MEDSTQGFSTKMKIGASSTQSRIKTIGYPHNQDLHKACI